MMSDSRSPIADDADDWLEGALRADARAAGDYIADAGFTAAVMQKLPAPVIAPSWRKPAVAALWAAAAGAAALAVPGTFADVAHHAYRLAAQPGFVPQAAVGVAALCAALYSMAAIMLVRR